MSDELREQMAAEYCGDTARDFCAYCSRPDGDYCKYAHDWADRIIALVRESGDEV